MLVGVRGHDVGKGTVSDLAKKIGSMNFPSMQLALGKAITNFDASYGKLSPGMANYVRDTFKNEGINIAVLGCYINPIHPDLQQRRKEIEKFKEHIRYARDFGSSIVGTETGSMNADYSYNPLTHEQVALDILVETITELVKEAEKFGVIVGIEGVTKNTISTPEKMKYVLDSIDSNNLQVIFDPVNLISIDNYMNQDEIIKKSFELFGDRMVILHAKDFIIEEVKMITVPAGKGLLNYKLVIDLIREYKPYINILLENATADTFIYSKQFLNDLYFSK